jgi:hypothetical protein
MHSYLFKSYDNEWSDAEFAPGSCQHVNVGSVTCGSKICYASIFIVEMSRAI